MQIDKTTFTDIAIFHSEESFSLFHKLNFTQTSGGKEWLYRFFNEPHSDLKRITGTQSIIKNFLAHLSDWPAEITNGTVLMIDKFLDYNLDPVPAKPHLINSFSYKWLHRQDYSFLKFAVKHLTDFYRGLKQIEAWLCTIELPAHLQFYVERLQRILQEKPLRQIASLPPDAKLQPKQYLYFAYHLRGQYKTNTLEAIDIFSRLEAWHSMAVAVKTYGLSFPEFIESPQSCFNAEGLYHLLLPQPVAYDVDLRAGQNFLFLTGANMAGKSTLIKAVGAAVFLAHIGMGVPAARLRMSVFDGLLTNINVADNIARGESYFFNEVQRIKNTIQKINDGKKWMVLIDELFKGTNVQDAMKCSLAVIKGLIRIPNSLFILSTHLYEIGEELKMHPNIAFRYFETVVTDDQLSFSYQLKEGISNDRIGYVILRREKVVEMLEKL